MPLAKPTAAPLARPTAAPLAKPTAAPRATPSDGPLSFEGEVVEFEYSSRWRISDRSDSSITYTHVSAPGNALLTVQWVSGVTAELASQFSRRVELFADSVVRLENTEIDGVPAKRALVAAPGPGGGPGNLVLTAVAISGGNGIMVAFAAPADRFESLAPDAEQFIASMRIRR